MRKSTVTLALVGLSSVLWLKHPAVLAADEKPVQPPQLTPLPSANLPDPVAVVNGKPIPRVLYEAYAQQRRAQLGNIDTAEARQRLVNELVTQELLVQEAEKERLADDPQVKAQLEMLKNNALATAVVRRWLSEHTPSDEDIQKEYTTATAAMGKKEYKARHILVDSEDKAKEVIGQLQKGTDFSELAKTQSSDSSAAQGGDLGWFTTDMMVEPFGQAVGKLEKGKYTQQPVQTQFGWHVILLDDIRDATPPSLEQVRPQVAQMVQGRILNDYLNKLREGAKVDIKIQQAAQ